jgi:dienelactone hydrolase
MASIASKACGPLLAFCVVACASPPSTAADPTASFHVRAASGDRSVGYAVLLPGSSGLEILGDGEHYFRAAELFNDHCLDVVVVDYKQAYRDYGSPQVGDTGAKIAWVAAQAANWFEANHPSAGDDRLVVAWSLGAEALWDPAMTKFDAGIAYYPSVPNGASIGSLFGPLLILQGRADDVTPIYPLETAIGGDPNTTILSLEGAFHGFDVATLAPKRVLKFPPVVGKRATLGYDALATERAEEAIHAFLGTHGLGACDISG